MPSLKELFKTQPLSTQNGKVGAEAYDIRNSKDIPISTANSILNATIFPLVQKTLRSSGLLTARTKENLVESELVGLRAIGTLSQPIIYGTDIVRINRKTTSAVITMKSAATGTEFSPDAGVFGNIIELGKKKATTLLSKVGIVFPENLLPSKLAASPM
jgi:hypothetical protein